MKKKNVLTDEEMQDLREVTQQFEEIAPELGNAAGSMLGSLVKKFWWIPVLALGITFLFISGIIWVASIAF